MVTVSRDKIALVGSWEPSEEKRPIYDAIGRVINEAGFDAVLPYTFECMKRSDGSAPDTVRAAYMGAHRGLIFADSEDSALAIEIATAMSTELPISAFVYGSRRDLVTYIELARGFRIQEVEGLIGVNSGENQSLRDYLSGSNAMDRCLQIGE